MKMIVEANTVEEITLLSRAVSMALGCTHCPTPQIAQTAEVVGGENPEIPETPTVEAEATVKKRRSRKSETSAVTETAATDTPVTVAPPCTRDELKATLVRKADSSPEMNAKVVALIQKYTTDGTVKTANIPEDKFADVLAEIETLGESIT